MPLSWERLAPYPKDAKYSGIRASDCYLFSTEHGKFFPGPSSSGFLGTTEVVSLQKLCPNRVLLGGRGLGTAQRL